MSDVPHPDDRRTAELLRSLESDTSRHGRRRAEILDDVLAHYDEERRTSFSSGEFVHVGEAPPIRAERPIKGRWLVAAAAIVVAIVGFLVVRSDETPTRLDVTGEPDGQTTLEDNVDAEDDGAVSAPTNNRVEVLGGRITFEAISGLSIAEEPPFVAVLGPGVSTSNAMTDAIVMVDRGSARFADRVSEFEIDSQLFFSFSQVRVDGELLDQWSVSLSQAGVDEFGCTINVPCFEVVAGEPSTAITSGTILSVTELIADDGTSVLFLIDEQGPRRRDLASLLATVEVS